MIPLPLIVNPLRFLNSSHCKRPEPQGWELVGAMILPSNCMVFHKLILMYVSINRDDNGKGHAQIMDIFVSSSRRDSHVGWEQGKLEVRWV